MEKKKKIKYSIIAGLGVVSAAVIGVIIKNNNSNVLSKYNSSFFKKASLDTLDTEREKVRLMFCDMKYVDINDKLYYLLKKFDDAISLKKYGPNRDNFQLPKGGPHGWYLYKDE